MEANPVTDRSRSRRHPFAMIGDSCARHTACCKLRWRGWKYAETIEQGASMKMMRFGIVVVGVMAAVAAAHAQAPAGAPAGANGICKDGTYSMSSSKSGACRGHKGVQSWYAAPAANATTKTSAMPVPSPMALAPSKPAPTPAASVPVRPASVPPAMANVATPTTAANPARRLGPSGAAATRMAAPGGGPGLVWLNTESKVYHCNSDSFYGKTKMGSYMSEADAKAKGAHGAHGGVCTK